MFLIFLNFFNIFFEFFWECPNPGQVETILGTKFFYLLFDLSRLDMARNKARVMFFSFLKFYTFFFFGNALAWVGLERNLERKPFCLFLGLSQPDSLGNRARMTFFNFFAIFLRTLQLGVGRNGIQNEIFFFISFSFYPNPVWHEMKAEICFYFFRIFLGMLQFG